MYKGFVESTRKTLTVSLPLRVKVDFCSEEGSLLPPVLPLPHWERKSAFKYLMDLARPVGGHLVGGCLRDWYWGRGHLVKDFDIFFPETANREAAVDAFVEKGVLEVPTKNMREDVDKVFKVPCLKTDLVFTHQSNIKEIVSSFDSSLCQIWLDIEDNELLVYCSSDFLKYKFGYWSRYMEVETSDSHLKRLRDKYGPYQKVYKQRMDVVCLGRLWDLEPQYAPISSI